MRFWEERGWEAYSTPPHLLAEFEKHREGKEKRKGKKIREDRERGKKGITEKKTTPT